MLPSRFDRYAQNPSGAKAATESGLSLLGETIFDIINYGANVGASPVDFIKGFGNKESAKVFDAKQQRLKDTLVGDFFDVSPETEEIQGQIIEPIANKVSELYNTGKYQNEGEYHSEFEAVEQVASDPRVEHTLGAVELAAPAFARVGRGFMDADFKKNLKSGSSPSGSPGKQKGFIIPAEEAIKRSDAAGETDLSTKLAVNHQIALQMLADKESPGDIALKTEFHVVPNKRGGDDLVWEVPGASMTTGVLPSRTGRAVGYDKVSDYYDNDLLYRLVPELKETKIDYSEESKVGEGWFNSLYDEVHLGTDASERGNYVLNTEDLTDMFDAGIHEISHKGQQIFSQPRGGSPSMFRDGSAISGGDRLTAHPRDEFQLIAQALTEGESAGGLRDFWGTIPSRAKEALTEIDKSQKFVAENDIFGGGDSTNQSKMFADVFRDETSTKFQKYQQLAGEASANADMERNWMSDQERLEKPYAEHMSDMGGVMNPRLLRFRDDLGFFGGDDKKVNSFTAVPKGQRGAINMLSGEGINTRIMTPASTRIPSDPQQFKQGIDAHGRGDLLVSSALLSDDKKDKLADIYRTYPGLRNIDPTDTQGALDQATDFMANNLRMVMDTMPDDWRESAMEWYEGFNRIAQDAGVKHNASGEQSAAVIAALSPQTEWNMNLTRADRVMDTYNTRQDFAWSPEMDDQMPNLRESVKDKRFADVLPNIVGKKLNQLDTPAEKALWIRAYDQAHNPREFSVYEPTGRQGQAATKKDGSPRVANWASTNPIEKAVSILEDGSRENISKQIGQGHKVRSFFRNAVDPTEETTTTMDTHAIATALMQPHGASATPVTQNFGAGVSDARTGMKGTYPINQDAYNKIANEFGVPGRAIQSPTWDFGRVLMENQKTTAMKDLANDTWKQFEEGGLTQKQAFDMIVESFGMPESPY
jgi:hypothetical protein